MTRSCKICTHKQLTEINAAIVQGRSLADLSREYAVSEDSLTRHKTNHLPPALAKAQEVKVIDEATDLLAQLSSPPARPSDSSTTAP